MKTAISVPDETFAAAERAAARLGISRSEFFARAAQRWVDELAGQDLTDQINASLEGVDQSDDVAFITAAAAATFARNEW